MTRQPHDYPWALPLREGVLHDDGFHGVNVERWATASRTPVLASGSNASPAVVHDKLGPTLGSGPDHGVLFTSVHVPGLGVGHSAHVSRPGYVAAAPYRFRSATDVARQPFALAWYTHAQLARLDETEPQYHRVPLPADLQARTTRQPEAVSGVQLYVSRHGLVAERGTPVSFRDQAGIFEWLRSRLTCLRAATMAEYADPELRERVRAELAREGWSAPSLLRDSAQR